MARLTRYEQETIINFNEEDATASVYTYNPALRRKLSQLAQERPRECVLDETRDYSGALVCTIPPLLRPNTYTKCWGMGWTGSH